MKTSDKDRSFTKFFDESYFFYLLVDDLIMLIFLDTIRRDEDFFSHKNFFIHTYVEAGNRMNGCN